MGTVLQAQPEHHTVAGGPSKAYCCTGAGTGSSRQGAKVASPPTETDSGEAEGEEPWNGEAHCWVTAEEPQMWTWGLVLELGRGCLGLMLAVRRGGRLEMGVQAGTREQQS